jgi:hypothetical protein
LRTALALLAALLATIGVLVLSDLTWRKRQQERELRDAIDDPARFVDVGVELRVIVADSNGTELAEGKPLARVLRTHRLGGMVDTRSNPPRIIGPSRDRVVWYCSEDQEPAILHGDGVALGQLVYGSEGAGKTVALVMWHYCRWLEHLGEYREGGQTAPTETRLEMFIGELAKLWPSSWYARRIADRQLVLCDGTRIQMVPTHRQSAAQGSPVQGFSWSWCGRDEAQDQIDAHSDIESRGRAAKRGRYKQLATATAKDDTAWRTLRDGLLASGRWTKHTMLGTRSPFIWPNFWDDKKATLTEREYSRRVLAQDVGPERMLYHTWSRAENLRAVPEHAEDVTAQVLAPWGRNISVLVGHDPGKLWHVSEFLKAYRVGPNKVQWFVVDEVSSRQATIETHVAEVLARLRNEWGANQLDWRGRPSEGGPVAMVRADPYSDSSGGEDKPDRGVYTTFRKAGIQIHPAAYVANATKLHVGRVPKEGRIDMVCRLLCNANGERRLFVACNERREPVAPHLVKALESMERDDSGRAEGERKDLRDQSHWPAALGYGLWAIERPKMERVA